MAGRYRLCARLPKSDFLDACSAGEWPLIIDLKREQIATSAVLRLIKGARLPIRLEDPDGYLSRFEGKRAGSHLVIGVQRGNAPFSPATLDRSDPKGRDLTVLVPYNKEVKLVVHNKAFDLEDDRGVALLKGAVSIPIALRRSEVGRKVTIRVKGGK